MHKIYQSRKYKIIIIIINKCHEDCHQNIILNTLIYCISRLSHILRTPIIRAFRHLKYDFTHLWIFLRAVINRFTYCIVNWEKEMAIIIRIIMINIRWIELLWFRCERGWVKTLWRKLPQRFKIVWRVNYACFVCYASSSRKCTIILYVPDRSYNWNRSPIGF